LPGPSKRRRISFYLSLPLVVAITFVLVIKLAAWQRADIISELADRVGHGDTPEASAAVRQLAAMSRPPIGVLVAAAASADRDVRNEAQHGISKLLRRSQREIEQGRRLRSVSQQLAHLAESLAAHQQAFSPADHGWLSATTHKIVRLANRIPPRHSPTVAIHCDAILGALTPGDVATIDFAELH
jgi:hypothetical protein